MKTTTTINVKLFLLLISVFIISDVNSQLDIDNLIGEDKDGITWHYEEFFESEFFIKDSLYHDELRTNVILSKRSGEFSTCQFSNQPISFKIKIYYDSIWEVCNMIELQTNCTECQENLLQYITTNSPHRKWKTMDGNSFISTKMLGSIKARQKEKLITYLFIQKINNVIVLTEKNLSKSEWKRMVLQLK